MYQNIFVDRENNMVYLWDDMSGFSTLPYSSFNYCYVPDKSGTWLTMNGKRVSKKYKPRTVFGEKYESDVPAETRILTELYLKR